MKRSEKKERQRKCAVANWIFAKTAHVVGFKSNFACGLVQGEVFKVLSFLPNMGLKFTLFQCFCDWIMQCLYYCTTIVTVNQVKLTVLTILLN